MSSRANKKKVNRMTKFMTSINNVELKDFLNRMTEQQKEVLKIFCNKHGIVREGI